MKIAPIVDSLQRHPSLAPVLLHTGQHYDKSMKDAFFRQLGIPEPDVDLEVGSGSHAEQTARIMLRFEPVLEEVSPLAVLVVGDVNSTIACGLVASKKKVPVIHVEAGLRSYDRDMPEEVNRVLTDQISDLLFITERSARENLLREGIAEDRIHFVGNVMIDALLWNLENAVPASQVLDRYGHVLPDEFAVLTLHRPSNVDEPETLRALCQGLVDISQRLPVLFPCHPRTAARIEQNCLHEILVEGRITLLPPLGYLEMLGLVRAARMVLTDSGGLQEETTALGVPCVTLRENTERPITVTEGTNTIVGRDPDRIRQCVEEILDSGGKRGRIPDLWDGKAAQRIVTIIGERMLGAV